MVTTNSKINTLLFGLALSFPLGLIFASLYVSLKGGFTTRVLREFDLLAFWYETPFYLGYASATFYTCLAIVGMTSVIIMVTLTVLMLRSQHFGTARWARFSEMRQKGYIKPYRRITGPIFGKTSGPRGFGQYLTNGEQPHSLIIAPTRAGKGVGVVIPTLLTFDGSVIALDVKGELFESTSRARLKRGDQIIKFSPLDREGRTHCYNPVLDIVATPPERRFSEARRLAVNLIAPKGKGAEGFIEGARDLFVAGILACIECGTPTIGAVYDLFAQPGEKYKLFAQLAEESKIPEVMRIFDNMAGNDTKILTSYTSVLGDGGLNLWADPLIKNATSRSDFSIYNLRRDPTTIYLCVSPNDLEVIAPLVRLFFQQTVSILQRTMPKTDEIFEVLFLLDEFKHLGKLEAIETAVTTIAGYKGRFMFIIQSLAALTGAYEQPGKENFLSNTGVQVFMATADDETPQYISKAIGDYTFRQKSRSYSQKEPFNANIQTSDQGAPLLRPEQVRLIDDNKQIVLIKGQPPLQMDKVKYYSDRHLKPIFESQSGALPEPDPIPLIAETEFAPNAVAQPTPAPVTAKPTAAPLPADPPVVSAGGNGSVSVYDDSNVSPVEADEFAQNGDVDHAQQRDTEEFEPQALAKEEPYLYETEPEDETEEPPDRAEVQASGIVGSCRQGAQEASEQPPGIAAQRELLARIIALQEHGISNSSVKS
ncbi:type IV secretion system ATPase VirD4 [Microvirga tunisiensis]|uniref:Type IV secretion system protein VirD4 n=1 Tax=Microvirga tunisiensis TaxID=2108360 RepID=A0A5N7MQ56_9HYPH|nr:type IV secretion system ATPase VirD4 [Microvirga tunisiensis]MPR11046.1 type IV secretion system protein VirD4 [Microvirga tunisiensis]MPR29151.1 type IV secretion system protein VirD4 [Microvirga tunisiensis]